MKKLFAPKQIALATLLGGPLATVFLLTKNYVDVDEPILASKTKKIGYPIIFLFFLGYAFLVKDPTAQSVVFIINVVVSFYISNMLQAKYIDQKIVTEKTFLQETWLNTIWNGIWAGIVTAVLAMVFGFAYAFLTTVVFNG